MAGLWESWRDEEDQRLRSFTIITTDANEATRDVHDRMPVILSPPDYDLWLNPDFDEQEPLQSLLEPYDPNDTVLDPVSMHVNNSRHDDPECIEIQQELF